MTALPPDIKGRLDLNDLLKGGTDGLATDEQESAGHWLDRWDRLRHRLVTGAGRGNRRGQRSLAGAGRGGRPAHPEREQGRPGDGGGGGPRHEGGRGSL